MQNKVTTYEWLKQALAELDDDLTRPWQDYPCLDWPFSINSDGYGQTHIPGLGVKKAHREAWKLIHGQIPSSVHVLHRCDRPICWRPVHLFSGSNEDNIADRMQKGRSRSHGPLPMLRGESHGLSKLMWDEVRQIRLLKGTAKAVSVAPLFNVSPTTICRIWRGTHWIEE